MEHRSTANIASRGLKRPNASASSYEERDGACPATKAARHPTTNVVEPHVSEAPLTARNILAPTSSCLRPNSADSDADIEIVEEVPAKTRSKTSFRRQTANRRNRSTPAGREREAHKDVKPPREEKCSADVSVTVKFDDGDGVLECKISISGGASLAGLLHKIISESSDAITQPWPHVIVSKWDEKYKKFFPTKAADYASTPCENGAQYDASFFIDSSPLRKVYWYPVLVAPVPAENMQHSTDATTAIGGPSRSEQSGSHSASNAHHNQREGDQGLLLSVTDDVGTVKHEPLRDAEEQQDVDQDSSSARIREEHEGDNTKAEPAPETQNGISSLRDDEITQLVNQFNEDDLKSITDNVGYNGASSPRFSRSAQSPHELDHEPTRSSKQNEGDVVNNNNDDESPSMFDHGPIDIDDFDGCLREYEAERKQDDEEVASNACDGNQSDGDSDANDVRSDTGESAPSDADVDEGAILDQSITFSDDENDEESIDVEQDSSDEEEPLSDVAPFSNQKSRADRRETPHANVERAISVTQPKGFLSHVRLFDHQISGIEWMLKREGDSKCRGGILADEPGLGKTLTVAGLLLHAKQHVEHYRPPPQVWDALGKPRARGALIVVPTIVVYQWKAQITKVFIRPHALNVVLYYGPTRHAISPETLKNADVVLTSYGTLSVDLLGYKRKGEKIAPTKRLSQFRWKRFVLDEAHRAKSEKSFAITACNRISAEIRWLVTGTPIDGSENHKKSLLRFLQADEHTWDDVCLSRTKEGVINSKKHWHDVPVRLSDSERKVYDRMTEVIKDWRKEANADSAWVSANNQRIRDEMVRKRPLPDDFDELDEEEQKLIRKKFRKLCRAHPAYRKHTERWTHLSSMYPMYKTRHPGVFDLRLRQAAVHLAIAEKAVDKNASDEAVQALDSEVKTKLVDDGANKASLATMFEPEFRSAKIERLVELLVPIVNSGDKCVVVSQWKSLLKIVSLHLDRADISHRTLAGDTPAETRYTIAQRFNLEEEPRVLLVAIHSCGEGVDLPGGNHMFLVEPQRSGAEDKQVFDRLHRIGQTKDVHCYRMISVDTVEEEVSRQRVVKEIVTKKLMLKKQDP